MRKLFTAIILIIVCIASQAQPDITLDVYKSGFSRPIDIVHCDDDRLFIVEQRGKIKIIDGQGNILATPFLDISNLVNQTGNERGLLGMTFHPDFKNNGYFYVNYTSDDLGGDTKISRFSVSQADSNLADVNSEVNLLTVNQPYTNHNAGDLAFGPDGYLYFGLGDGGLADDPQNRAQNPQTLLGKMIRIDVDNGNPYSIPADNPFVNDQGVLDEIWAIGLRNPWRFSFDRCTGDMWIGDVGQDDWEEVDFEPAGQGGHNYGWRCYEGDHTFNTSGCGSMGDYTFPVAEYANPNIGCSITGGFVYRGGQYGGLFGYYLYADYCSGRIWSIIPDLIGGWSNEEIANLVDYQYSTFGEDRYGELYVAGLDNGNIYKISEANCKPTAYIKTGDTVIPQGQMVDLEAIYGEGLTYTWQLDGNDIPNSNSSTYTANQAGNYTVIVENQTCSDTSSAVVVDIETGYDELVESSVNIYPNPATDELFVSFESKYSNQVTLDIYNAMGQLVLSERDNAVGGGNRVLVDISGLVKGFYTLDIMVGNHKVSRKVLVTE